MGNLENFSLEQLSIFIVAVLGACGGCIAVLFKSKCDTISTPCLKIHRKIDNTKSNELPKNNP